MKRTPMAGIDLPGNLPLAWEALAARDAEIERLRELVEKRERQLVWAVQYRPEIVHDDRGNVLWAAIHSDHGIEFDGTDAGLLAAIDEAAKEAK